MKINLRNHICKISYFFPTVMLAQAEGQKQIGQSHTFYVTYKVTEAYFNQDSWI